MINSKDFAELAPKIKTIVFEWHNWSGFNPDQLVNTLKGLWLHN